MRTRASVFSTLREVRSLMAAMRLGRLEGLAYQSPPPSYCRRATTRRGVSSERAARRPNIIRAAAARFAATRRSIEFTVLERGGKRDFVARAPRAPAWQQHHAQSAPPRATLLRGLASAPPTAPTLVFLPARSRL